MKIRPRNRALLLAAAIVTITVASTGLRADTGTCGGVSITLPYTDVPSTNIFFCSIAEAFFSGLTYGTSATTYSPSDPVLRGQMAAFITHTMDQSVKRSSKRAALDQFWTTQTDLNLTVTAVGANPLGVKSDGADLWVANGNVGGTVERVRASDGRLLETWTGATSARGVLVALGKIFVGGETNPGRLYQIDPTQSPGIVTTVASNLGAQPEGIAFDGQRIWTANYGNPPSVSIVTLSPLTVTTVTSGFTHPGGIIYDGANIWMTDVGDSTLKKLDSSGSIILSVPVGFTPQFPAFDGTNIWVPNTSSDSVSVVRATGALTGTVVATLTGNGLLGPRHVAFDGERILVTNNQGATNVVNSVSLWRASDLTPIGTFPTGLNSQPGGACSDGLNFWITLFGTGKLVRF